MTDTHGSTPGNGPVPPTQGDEHAQHAAPMGQQPYYQQQQQYYQQPQHPQHPAGGVTVEKKSHGGRTFLLAFCGAAVACAIGLGGFGIWQATAGGNDSGSSSSATQLGSQNSGSINATDAESGRGCRAEGASLRGRHRCVHEPVQCGRHVRFWGRQRI